MERQDGPDDGVLTPREPGHHSPLQGSLLDPVMLTEGSPGSSQWPQLATAEWFPEISGSNVHIKVGQSMRGDRFKEEFVPPGPTKAH